MFLGFVVFVILISLVKYQLWRIPRSWSVPRIVMYHSIDANESPSGMNMHPEIFEQQVRFMIKRGFKFYTVSELIKSQSSEKKKVALTFDDGFENNYSQLFPILKKYNIKATIYLAPNIKDIKKLNALQIKEMQDSGLIEFGAHTMHHVNLMQCDAGESYKEIRVSKQVTELMTGSECLSFAYPFGRYDEKDIEIVKKLRFTSAVTTKKRIKNFDLSRPFTLPRLSTSGEMDIFEFYIMLSRGRYRI